MRLYEFRRNYKTPGQIEIQDLLKRVSAVRIGPGAPDKAAGQRLWASDLFFVATTKVFTVCLVCVSRCALLVSKVAKSAFSDPPLLSLAFGFSGLVGSMFLQSKKRRKKRVDIDIEERRRFGF